MRVCIFANGAINNLEGAKELLRPDDLLMAADGGAHHCRALGVVPKAIIGDMDSLSEQDLADWEDAGVQLIRHDPRKDETDLELALLYARSEGADEALVLGGLGGRWDQTFANLLLPTYRKLAGLQVSFWADGVWFYLVSGERKITGQPGEIVSLIPLGGDAAGVRTKGLTWPLYDETLAMGATRGVSNELIGESADVIVREGWLLVVVGSKDFISL